MNCAAKKNSAHLEDEMLLGRSIFLVFIRDFATAVVSSKFDLQYLPTNLLSFQLPDSALGPTTVHRG